MNDAFRWNAWNIDHIAMHGVGIEQAEDVVTHVTRPYPSYEGDGKWLVRGQTANGEYLQVIYIIDPEPARTLFVIHARRLSNPEKRQLRRRRK